ncbi:MAG: RNA polymerase sigma-70 factor [Prevotellaceae bacterium]|jgi:RNA polymerase sigma-70 factor (ECF subfamily)|nr:RNA polymerase sigma-70 factor [Prevotellaceae bacterium]
MKNGDKAAFSTLYFSSWERVYRFARLYTASESDAEDTVQEVFIKLWDNREQIDENKPIENYLFILTRNHLFNLNQKKRNEEQLQLTALQALDMTEPADANDKLHVEELRKHIARIVDKLPARRKEVFLLSRTGHLSHAEIADRLSITQRAVERHIYLALGTLRSKLRTLYGADTGMKLYGLFLLP